MRDLVSKVRAGGGSCGVGVVNPAVVESEGKLLRARHSLSR
jgi:hypothetical protein